MIGGWRIKYLRAKQKPKQAIHPEYQRRNESLPFLGYATYRECLASDEWKQIKSILLERNSRCLLCARKACVVHHMSYDDRTMLGIDTSLLVCLCDGCHEVIEIDAEGGKRSLTQANDELKRRAIRAGRQPWVKHIQRRERVLAIRTEIDAEAARPRKAKKPTPEETAQRKKWKEKWKTGG